MKNEAAFCLFGIDDKTNKNFVEMKSRRTPIYFSSLVLSSAGGDEEFELSSCITGIQCFRSIVNRVLT